MIKLRIRWAGYVTHMGEEKCRNIASGGKAEGKRLLARARHR
jgi:hypothetical protein